MSIQDVSGSKEPSFLQKDEPSQVDLPEARAIYEKTISNPKERHLEIGILTSNETEQYARLGKEGTRYGPHRVGSVTKTFTTFLAFKLIHEGYLTLESKCGDFVPPDILEKIFENPTDAANMTLEQLLSHTSGLEYSDHIRNQDRPCKNLHERFLKEVETGTKFKHNCKPGEELGIYSNAGLAVAGWMLELAYNRRKGHETPVFSFAEIMQSELFTQVFGLTESKIEPGVGGDNIQDPAGGMTSSVEDLMIVAKHLQKGEAYLAPIFGNGWQKKMLEPRDLLEKFGLGCEGNALEHKGLNIEDFNTEIRDVSALIVLPINAGDPSVVAVCDSNALGPIGGDLIHSLKTTAGIHEIEKPEIPYDPLAFCPESSTAHVFHGSSYLVTDVDPFDSAHPLINCSRNGRKHILQRDTSLDIQEENRTVLGYRDQYDKPWVVISRKDGSKTIYSDGCLVTKEIMSGNIALAQPDANKIKQLQGVYRDAEKPKEHSQFTFIEENGCLYVKEDEGEKYPCLFIPEKNVWVACGGREIQFRFPDNPDQQYVFISDILNDIQEPPEHCIRKETL